MSSKLGLINANNFYNNSNCNNYNNNRDHNNHNNSYCTYIRSLAAWPVPGVQTVERERKIHEDKKKKKRPRSTI